MKRFYTVVLYVLQRKLTTIQQDVGVSTPTATSNRQVTLTYKSYTLPARYRSMCVCAHMQISVNYGRIFIKNLSCERKHFFPCKVETSGKTNLSGAAIIIYLRRYRRLYRTAPSSRRVIIFRPRTKREKSPIKVNNF